MSLETRLAALIAAIGADIKALQSAGGGPPPYYLAPDTTYSVAQYKQVQFGTTIDSEGFLDIEGILEEA